MASVFVVLLVALALSVGLLVAVDPVWGAASWTARAGWGLLWILMPFGVVALGKQTEIESELSLRGAFIAYVCALAVTRGRPALIMVDVWPQDALADEALHRRSRRVQTTFLCVVMVALLWDFYVYEGP